MPGGRSRGPGRGSSSPRPAARAPYAPQAALLRPLITRQALHPQNIITAGVPTIAVRTARWSEGVTRMVAWRRVGREGTSKVPDSQGNAFVMGSDAELIALNVRPAGLWAEPDSGADGLRAALERRLRACDTELAASSTSRRWESCASIVIMFHQVCSRGLISTDIDSAALAEAAIWVSD